ncbi:DNA-binding response regulator [Longibacter salinarum]|uniref:DNA-binding response regulator n=1 Tax=Longibacter salinarum TaxID=1850348 RepID=A0A2A8CVI1_9BACT|nr:response regulator transcription factor [Longibacter salinarum]PEN12656.1 DNA-binding response regulator [Longibacter salinarum]
MLTSIVIAEDHQLTADGIQGMLDRELGARVAARCTRGGEVIPSLREHTPDILTLDLNLPGISGLDLLTQIQSVSPNTRTIVYSGHEEDAYVVRAFHLGARGYVLKGDAPSELIAAVKAAIHGERYLSPSLPERLLEMADEEEESATTDRFDLLTKREIEVMNLVVEGLTSAEIGDELFISKRTVDKHRQNLMAKLDVSRTADLIHLVNQRTVQPSDLPGEA